jgi:hypothetical protein
LVTSSTRLNVNDRNDISCQPTPRTTMTATPAPRLDPLSTELRLRALEARVRGVPASALEPEPEVSPKPASTKTKGDATDSADAADDSDAPTLARRTEQLRAKLGGVADTSAPIRQFLDNCK